MKDKIMVFIMGMLVGAIIITGGFYAYSKNNSSNHNSPSMPGEQNGQPPEIPNNNQEASNETNNN